MQKFKFNDDAVFGSDEWKKRMAENGKVLKKNNVKEIIFVHGTFAGNDAFGLFSFMEPLRQAFPQAKSIFEKMKEYAKHSVNYFAKDLGNFSPEYCDAFHKAVGNINSNLFVWSGGNYHLARLRGVVELIHLLAESVRNNNITKADRIMLWGHSHAGQLFAMLSLFLEDGDTAKGMYKAVETSPVMRREELIEDLLTIDGIPLDFVTFGTPVRYCWGQYDHYRLLSVINHRSLVQITGLLETKDGDYVQQWGTEGTDTMPPVNEVKINDSLDKVLDRGRTWSRLMNRLQRKRRLKAKKGDGHLVGHTLLVDYRDDEPDPRLFDEKSSPIHSIRTQFGHGVYTLKNAMLFNIDLIVDQLYTEKQED